MVWLTVGAAASGLVLVVANSEIKKRDAARAEEKDQRLASDLKSKDVEIGRANEAAAIANERTVGLERGMGLVKTRQAEAEERAAVAERSLESERLARLDLENSMAPRVLIRTGTTNSRLSRFGAIKVRIEAITADVESLRVADALHSHLSEAGWKVTPVVTQDWYNGRAGIDVMTVDRNLVEAAEELSEFILANRVVGRVVTDAKTMGELTKGDTAGIVVRVGMRPQPVFFRKTVEMVRSNLPPDREMDEAMREADAADEKALADRMTALHAKWYPAPKWQ